MPASRCSTRDVAFANAVNAGVSLLDASRMASTTPANAFGWYVGTIEQLCFADAVVLGPDLDVQKVMKRGEWLP